MNSLAGGRGDRGLRSELVAMLTVLALACTALALAMPPGSQPALTPGEALSRLPLSFIPNEGQTDERVRFYVQGAGHAFYFTPDEAVLSFTKNERGVALRLTPLGANPDAKLEPGRPASGRVNYMVGAERHTNLSTYRELSYRNLWPGVDMVYRGQGGTLKYELRLRPGADPSKIGLSYAGARSLTLSRSGGLRIHTRLGTLRDSAPRSYQVVNGRKVAVGSRFALREGNAYGFALGPSYDPSLPLVIDPGIAYSSYLGGSATDQGFGIAVDAAGSAYVAGNTYSSPFPTTAGAFDTALTGPSDAFVTKLNAAGSALVYSTYLGGTGFDAGTAIALDGPGSAYVTGYTYSSDFPTTGGAFDTSFNGSVDAFATKLDPSGAALSYSTFLGGTGNDEGGGIALDGAGSAYVTGNAAAGGYPTTAGALDTTHNGGDDVFVTKLDSSGSSLAYSTYLGGTGGEQGQGIAADGAGGAYVTGYTGSTAFPTTAGSFDTSYNGGFDAFATKLDASGAALSYSAFLGGTSYDQGNGIGIDGAGGAYVTGYATSTNFPTTAGAFDTSYGSGGDGFVTKLNPAGSAASYSTYLGGTGTDYGNGIAVHPAGNAYVSGYTTSGAAVSDTPFPTTAGAFDTTHNGSEDGFVTMLNGGGSALFYSSYLGGTGTDYGNGIAVDDDGLAYVTGRTVSSDFPTTAGAFDTTSNGNGDGFVTKFDFSTGPAAGYVSPKGATPVRTPFVPAMAQCSSPDSTHGSPLSNGSCSNPGAVSSTVTLGASTDPFARLGQGRIIVCTTTSAPGCSTLSAAPDVRLFGNGSDVVCKAGAPPAACPGGAGSDYDPNAAAGPYTAGLDLGTNANTTPPTPLCNPSTPNPPACAAGADMTAVAQIPGSTSTAGSTIRITDSFNNIPSTGDPAICTLTTSCSGTVEDQAFDVPVVCQATSSAAIGSFCGVNTTANALVPGVVVGGKAAIVEIGQIQVFDSGPDGIRDNGDDQLFAVQGLVVP